MQIQISHDCPPIPMRDFDYAAYDEDTYEGGSTIGYGPTAFEAVVNFVEQLEDANVYEAIESAFSSARLNA